ncbi:hypothetical protein HKX48_008182 [Thoreauomyces humboldtii]|nr:hypothetical protein HKX48_008182 [Thoreauomyces humboldtii]
MSAATLPSYRVGDDDTPRQQLSSRNHRKQRHHLATPMNNISLHIAILFTLGSVAWCVNGLYTKFPDGMRVSEGLASTIAIWAAFAGGWLFEGGAFLTYLEACNVDHPPPPPSAKVAEAKGHELVAREETYRSLNFKEPRTHTLGWKAAAVQMFAATVFAASVVTGIWAADWGHVISVLFFWLPQMMGGMGFIIASLIYMKEVGWLRLGAIGWHVAFWNLIGAIGFFLCGVFGIWYASDWGKLASDWNNFYGGWAFLIGSLAQLAEVIRHKEL